MEYNPFDFLFGGLSASGATIFTNPLEVIKIRMQLQGELSAKGTYKKPYKNVFSSFATICRKEGVMGLQKGLIPSINFQFFMHSARLGIYNTALRQNRLNNALGEKSLLKGFIWGALSSIVGSIISNPLYIVKTQLQSQAAKETAVGYQHKHSGMTNALKTIYLEHGLAGLWRGVQANALLTASGSGVQLGTFTLTKDLLTKHNLIKDEKLNSFTSGFIAGSFKTIIITPVDVVMTRVFNQPVDKNGKGLLYDSVIDCMSKMFKIEGVEGFYKGFWASFIRVVPHGTLTLVIFDELLAMQSKFKRK